MTLLAQKSIGIGIISNMTEFKKSALLMRNDIDETFLAKLLEGSIEPIVHGDRIEMYLGMFYKLSC